MYQSVLCAVYVHACGRFNSPVAWSEGQDVALTRAVRIGRKCTAGYGDIGARIADQPPTGQCAGMPGCDESLRH
jgi:hypothetical protein